MIPTSRKIAVTILLPVIIALSAMLSPLMGQNYTDPDCHLDTINNRRLEIGLNQVNNDTLRAKILVNEVPNNGSDIPNLCGVRVHYIHENIGDLEMFLIAPNGQQVQLVGPARIGMFNPVLFAFAPTNDLYFDNSGNTTSPVYRNDNVVDNTVPQTGDFRPFFGDFLTDFTAGEVVGIWELLIVDRFLNERGLLLDFEIEFCNKDDEAVCNACEAETGTFTEDSIVLCNGSNETLTAFYNDVIVEDLAYIEDYFIFNENDEVVLNGVDPFLPSLDSGLYQVYVVTIDSSQHANEIGGLAGLNRQALIDSVASIGGFLCMDISPPMALRINTPDTIKLDSVICHLESVTFNGQVISNAGVYYGNEDAFCESITELTLTRSNFLASFDQTTVGVDCATGSTLYGPTISGARGTVSYEWRDGSGSLVSSDSSLTLTTNETFNLMVSDGFCDTAISVTSMVGGLINDLTIIPDFTEFNCAIDSVNLQHNSTDVVTVEWRFNNVRIPEFDGRTAIKVGEIGMYEVFTEDRNGCQHRGIIDLERDTTLPDVQIAIPGMITCTQTVVNVTFVNNSTNGISRVNWTDENGNDLGSSNILTVSRAGNYNLTVVGSNLCSRVYRFEVQSDQSTVAISDFPANNLVLNCDDTSFDINPTRDASLVAEEYWIFGADDTMRVGIDLPDNSLTITEPNLYRYVIVAHTGCVTSEILNVPIDTIRPMYDLRMDSITCNQLEATLSIINTNQHTITNWDFSGIVDQTDSTVTVDEPGRLNFTIIDTSNFCSILDSFQIIENRNPPDINLSGNTEINCQTPQAQLDATFLNGTPAEFYWLTPNGDTSFLQSIVTNDTGRFYFEAMGMNGCTFLDSIDVTEDIRVPMINLPSSVTVNCTTPNVVLAFADPSIYQSIEWNVDGQVFNTDAIDVAPQSNALQVQVAGLNGCFNSSVITVVYDTIAPEFELISDTITCDQSTAIIRPSGDYEHHTFLWSGNSVSNATSDTLLVDAPGAYALLLTDTLNGCFALDPINVTTDFAPPTFSVRPVDVITCKRTSVPVSVDTDDGGKVSWMTSDGRIFDGMTVIVDEAGDQFFKVEGSNGCLDSAFVTVTENRIAPSVTIDRDYLISCSNPTQTLSPVINEPIDQIRWTFKNGNSSSNNIEVIDNDELEALVVTGINGCQTTIDFNITIASDIPQAEINETDTLICSGASLSLSTNPLVSPDHRIFWYRDLNFVSEDALNLTATETGRYTLQVLDTISGCENFDTINVTINPSPLSNLEIDFMDESCEAFSDAFIHVTNVVGGFGTPSISMEGLDIGLIPVESVEEGTYNILVEDELGCSVDSTISIMSGRDARVSLGSNIVAERGDTVTIVPQYSGETAISIRWVGNDGELSTDAGPLVHEAVRDDVIIIEAVSETGCISIDSISLEVFVDADKIQAYVPNIIHPNSRAGNNEITITMTPDMMELTDFSIYNRWGQQINFVDRIGPGESRIVWNGTFNGLGVQPGVYVYSYQLLTIHDNKRRTFYGDITVID